MYSSNWQNENSLYFFIRSRSCTKLVCTKMCSSFSDNCIVTSKVIEKSISFSTNSYEWTKLRDLRRTRCTQNTDHIRCHAHAYFQLTWTANNHCKTEISPFHLHNSSFSSQQQNSHLGIRMVETENVFVGFQSPSSFFDVEEISILVRETKWNRSSCINYLPIFT